jgi:hypothetical protein
MSESPLSSLSLEQMFSLRKYQEQLRDVSREELEELFIEIVRQKMAQENLFRDMIKGG